MNRRKKNTVTINKVLILCVVLSFFAAIIKVLIVSLSTEVDGLNLTEFADSRNTEKEVLYAKRGSIYDVNGEKLAESVNSYTVIGYISSKRTTDENNPQHVVDKELTAKELSPLINVSEEQIINLLSKDLYQVDLKRGVSELVKSKIEALDLPGIDFVESSKRWYKMGNFASYIIGYAQADDDGKIIGKMGIEAKFDDVLTGTDGYTEYQKDAYGYKMPQTTPIVVDAKSGNDVYLTIDNNIQMFVENGIKAVTNKVPMDWLVFEVMDAKTGAIVASGSSPNFNLNTLDNIENYLNPLTSYEYEPGSTMKIFSFMSAMENGKYDGNATYQSGTIKVEDSTIKDFNGVGWGVITFDQGFAHSSNVAATHLAQSLGRDKLKDTYQKLGFGSKTGIELPGENEGDINFYYNTEVATASFGQGITTTPIQNLQALSSLTNEGSVLKPYIVSKIVDPEGNTIFEAQRTEVNKVASASTAEKLLSLMYNTVYEGPTDAKFFKADNVTIVGKTGTAQIAAPTGGYMTGDYDYIKSFAGVFPYEDPQYIVYVSTKRLQGSFREVGNMTKKIIEEIAKYKNITDSVEHIDETKIVSLNNYISIDLIETEEKLKKLNLEPVAIGSGKYIVNQYPLSKAKVEKGSKVFLLTNDTNYIMPDVTKWTSSEIISFCNIIGLKYELNGYGLVESTSISSGSLIDLNTPLIINLVNIKK